MKFATLGFTICMEANLLQFNEHGYIGTLYLGQSDNMAWNMCSAVAACNDIECPSNPLASLSMKFSAMRVELKLLLRMNL